MRSFMMSKTLIRNLFSGPATRMHPKKKRTFTPVTRGKVENDINRCIFCGLCSRRCPTYAIKVMRDVRQWQIDRLKCCTCNLCVEVCPVKCLSMDNLYAPPVPGRNEAVYTTSPDGATDSPGIKGSEGKETWSSHLSE